MDKKTWIKWNIKKKAWTNSHEQKRHTKKKDINKKKHEQKETNKISVPNNKDIFDNFTGKYRVDNKH